MRQRRIIMIELTDEQAKALESQEVGLPRVVNPRTQETFALIGQDVYERVQKALAAYNRAWDDPTLHDYEHYRA
jgi:hypothetical protein